MTFTSDELKHLTEIADDYRITFGIHTSDDPFLEYKGCRILVKEDGLEIYVR